MYPVTILKLQLAHTSVTAIFRTVALAVDALFIVTLCTTYTEICAGQVVRSAGAPVRGTGSLALASNHLNDSLGSWWNIACGWLELPIIILVVAVLQ